MKMSIDSSLNIGSKDKNTIWFRKQKVLNTFYFHTYVYYKNLMFRWLKRTT